jgi:hypothetical protein
MLKLAAILSVPFGLLAAVASMGVVVVDVREGGPDGQRIVVPVPLVVAQAGLALVPARHARVNLGDAARYLPMAREVVRAIAEGPDAELVLVEQPDERVRVAKQGRYLRVRVEGRGENVNVNLPFDLVLAALPDENAGIVPARIGGALWSARFTDLVEVRDGRDHVKISVW